MFMHLSSFVNASLLDKNLSFLVSENRMSRENLVDVLFSGPRSRLIPNFEGVKVFINENS